MKKISTLNILLPIIFISFFLININVSYFGDDYYFLSFKEYDTVEYFSKLGTHYLKDNGRLIVHFLDTLFLKFNPIFWQLLNSLMLTGICYFSAKIIAEDDKEKIPILISIMFLFLSLLDIQITRQSVYWITGSFNYVYPMFVFFAYWDSLLKISKGKRYFFLSIIFGILSSASVEQVGMMTFGLTFLIFVSKFIENKNIKLIHNLKNTLANNKRIVVLLIITLSGVLSVLLAPSQFIRLNSTESTNIITTIKENTKFILTNFTSVKNILPYVILFNLFVFAFSIKKSKTILLISIINLILNCYFIFFNNTNVFDYLRWIAISMIIFIYIIQIIYINKKTNNNIISILTIAIILLVGSQFMMMISPVIGYRNLVSGLILFAFIITIIASNINFNKKFLLTITTMFLVISAISNLKTSIGYYQNKIIDNKNIEIIKNTNMNRRSNEIILYKFLDDNYGWSMPYISKFHEDWYKKYYNLNYEIRWVESNTSALFEN